MTGAVQCAAGRNVVGVWVASTGAASGWASWKANPDRDDVAYYSRTITSAADVGIALHVGCGGSPAAWQTTPDSGVVSGTVNDFICYDVAGQPGYDSCSHSN